MNDGMEWFNEIMRGEPLARLCVRCPGEGFIIAVRCGAPRRSGDLAEAVHGLAALSGFYWVS